MNARLHTTGRDGEAVIHYHTPVMAQEVIAALQVKADGRYIDCTAGEGGHSLAILQAAEPPPQLLCLDVDAEALQTAQRRLSEYGGSATIRHANYADMERVAAETGFTGADGLLLDLGLSSLQLDKEERGFSFRHEANLDMRFNPSQSLTAYEIVNRYSESELANVIYLYGEERRSRRIAKAIVNGRPVRTTTRLADIVLHSVGGRRGRIHPATRTFQAIRIAVNDEFGNIQHGLDGAIETLGSNGRLAVIAYHSIEDRIVKNALRLFGFRMYMPAVCARMCV